MTRTNYGAAPTRIADALIELVIAGPAQVTEATGLPHGTVTTTMNRMGKAGYLERLPAGGYRLKRHPDTGQTYELKMQLVASTNDGGDSTAT